MTSETELSDGSDSFERVDLDDVANEIVARKQPDVTKIRAWLQPTDYAASSSEYMRHLSSQAPGTGEWIRETTQFDLWHLSPDHGSIWIKAVPGAGKSVIAASMVKSLSEDECVPVLFFFFRHIIEKNRTSRSLLRDWLSQLLPSSAILQVSLWEHVESKVALETVSSEELWRHLQTALKSLPRAYCIVDALDEMELDHKFLERLNRLGTLKPKTIKLLMTSRPKQYLQQALRDPEVIHVSLEEELVKRDIALFVRQRAGKLVTHGINLELQNLVCETVCERSQGLFLYARLMLEQITDLVRSSNQDKQILRNVILKIPVGLEAMYDSVLAEHARRTGIDVSVQLFILQLVTHSSRPLRLIEIASALKSCLPSTSWNRRKELVRSGCGPLLECMEDETIGVLHHSFTEFLTDANRRLRGLQSFPVVESSSAHRAIALVCLYTLQCNGVKGISLYQQSEADEKDELDDEYDYRRPRTMRKLEGIYEKVALMSYAVKNWFYHTRQLTDSTDDSFYDELTRFSVPRSSHFRAWINLYNASLPRNKYGSLSDTGTLARKGTTSLHIAAGFDLLHWAQRLIRGGVDLNARDDYDATAIYYASKAGHTGMVKLLLDAGADPDMDCCNGHKPLHEAASRNHAQVVRLLLEAGVSPKTGKTRDPGRKCGNAKSSIGYHPLQFAANRGHIDTVREMIPYLTREDLHEALGDAVSGGHAPLMTFLLDDAKLSPDCRSKIRHGGVGRTIGGKPILIHAIQSRNPECVKVLLDRRADINVGIDMEGCDDESASYPVSQRDESRSVLHHVAGCGPYGDQDETIQEMLDLLLAAGADLEARDRDMRTPLLHTISLRFPMLRSLELFIKAGADVLAKDKDGNTLLHQACAYSLHELETITRVLEAGLDPNIARISDGKTPLHLFLSRTHYNLEALTLLLEHGADVNSQDNDGNSPLHYMYRNSNTVMGALTLLTNRGAWINAQNKSGKTSLHSHAATGPPRGTSWKTLFEQKLDLAIDHGADLEIRDLEGESVLMTAVELQPHLVQLYLDLPQHPSVLTRTNQGKTLLHKICSVRRSYDALDTNTFDLLLKYGADPMVLDYSGNTLLHEFAPHFNGSSGDIEFISKLVKAGISPRSVNSRGQTAAHLSTVSTDRKEKNRYQHHHIPYRKSFVSVLLDLDPKFDPNTPDSEGMMALHNAILSSTREAYELIDAGADVTYSNSKGETPLHLAAKSGCADTVALLLAQLEEVSSSGIDSVDCLGNTALHYACQSHEPESVKLLIDSGCNIHIRNKAQKSAFEVFVESLPGEHAIKAPQKQDMLPQIDHDSKPMSSIYRAGEIRKLLRDAGEKSEATHDLFKRTDWLETAREGDGYTNSTDIWHRLRDVHETGVNNLMKHGINWHMTDSTCWSQDTPVTYLVSQAMTGAVRKVAHFGMLYDDPEFIRGFKSTASRNGLPQPLLQTACKSTNYNMSMIELLWNDGNIDVNTHGLVFQKTGNHSTENIVQGSTALHLLARGTSFWHIKALKYLLDLGADPNALDQDGATPLHVASSDHYGRPGFFAPQCCKVLLDNGADPNIVDNAGLVPLNRARDGRDIVGILLEAGANSQAGNKNVLISAIESASPQLVQLYLDHGADPNIPYKPNDRLSGLDMRHDEGDFEYPLVIACIPSAHAGCSKQKSFDMITLLLDHGAKIDLPINKDETLIHYLFRRATTERLEAFLERGELDLTIRDPHGRTVLMAALQSTQTHEYRRSFLYMDVRKQLQAIYVTAADALMRSDLHSRSIDYLAVDHDGRNILHYFVDPNPDRKSSKCDKEIPAHILTTPGVAELVHMKDQRGLTPFLDALRAHGNTTLEQLLTSFSPNLFDVGPSGNTCLHYIARAGLENIETRKHIIEKYIYMGGYIDVRNNAGETPLLAHLTVPPGDYPHSEKDQVPVPGSFSREKNLRYLIDLGADIRATTHDGDSALHVVARLKDSFETTAVFKMLIAEGCEALRENKEGKTALDIAAAKENKSILKLFARKKA
ncbi:ankyrin [Pseudovirgaria hyperparasitica]|uniref:Ankyrin n=1 Tax=Pseudovirgaria hyperparasitica TaxID=470096 RepID=A0A6A6WEK4_9PEZI|nr:ankyrin [Pseudovirgaria hyperparasitica]KAF2760464.1 ankyrin [Pseudovirgaria hyperparasitica]